MYRSHIRCSDKLVGFFFLDVCLRSNSATFQVKMESTFDFPLLQDDATELAQEAILNTLNGQTYTHLKVILSLV